jgi:hypothetical protein
MEQDVYLLHDADVPGVDAIDYGMSKGKKKRKRGGQHVRDFQVKNTFLP